MLNTATAAHQPIRETSPGIFEVQGALGFANAAHLLIQGQQLMAPHRTITFDLQKVTTSNSAGLALLTGWWRNALAAHKTLHFVNIPADLIAIAKVCGVTHLLKIESAQHG